MSIQNGLPQGTVTCEWLQKRNEHIPSLILANKGDSLQDHWPFYLIFSPPLPLRLYKINQHPDPIRFFFFGGGETLVCHFLSLLGFPNSHVPCLTTSPLSLMTCLGASRANLDLVTIVFKKYVPYFSILQQRVVSPNFPPPVRVPFSPAPTSIFLSKATLDDHWHALCGPSSFCLLIKPKDDCDTVIYNKKSVFGL